jgi:acyl carrier protein
VSDGTERRDQLLSLLQELGFEPSELTDDARFREDLSIDSTELVEISVAVEQKMLVPIDSETLWSLSTVGDLVELVESSPAVPS